MENPENKVKEIISKGEKIIIWGYFIDSIKRGEGSNGEVSKPDKIISLSLKN